MLDLLLNMPADRAPLVLALGAHCDDIEIGCGGTLLRLGETHPQASVHCVVFSSDEQRAAETRAALGTLLAGFASSHVEVLGFRDGYFPHAGAQIKDHFEALKRRARPDLVLTHARGDLHQDHRTIAELSWNTFRDHLLLEYEILKYDGDLGQPNVFVEIPAALAERKIDTVCASFVSQHAHGWFSAENFRALMRVRGVECNAASGYAEAFHGRKLRLAP